MRWSCERKYVNLLVQPQHDFMSYAIKIVITFPKPNVNVYNPVSSYLVDQKVA